VSDGLIAGFERRRLPGHDIEVDALVAGEGPPLLLLHGYPQTRMMWKAVAGSLAAHFTVVAPDLRGYGRSDKPEGGAASQLYSKRIMALDQIATMRALGFSSFAVAGHDRGARVAYRLALDHPQIVTRLGILDVIPTGEQWARVDAHSAMGAYHWYMLAQASPLPETLIGADPDFYVQWTLKKWAAQDFNFDAESLEDYLTCFRDRAAIHASCEDYRAGWGADRDADEADRGKRRISAPVLVLYGEQYSVAKSRPLETWRDWADDVRGHGVCGGHFIAEEAPDAVISAFREFFAQPGLPHRR
jgi:haloacetate dehalogenase